MPEEASVDNPVQIEQENQTPQPPRKRKLIRKKIVSKGAEDLRLDLGNLPSENRNLRNQQ